MANELKTYGDLKKTIKAISLKQKGEKIGNIAMDTVLGAIPGFGTAKTTYDVIKAAISRPDTKKTNTWLDKLDIDDDMSKIIDDTVESGFMQMISKTIEGESDSKPLEQDFNMNQKLVNYLKQNYKGRTVTGIQENKMKEKLRQLIREEIKKTISEVEAPKQDTTVQGSFRADIFKKLMGSSFDSAKFNSAMTKLKNNQSRSTTDNAFLGDVVRALMYTDDNVMLNNIFNYLKTLKTKPKA
jgi:hypothetical protein